MVYVCPNTGTRLAKKVRCFNELGELLYTVDGDDHVVEWLRSKAYIGVGSTRRITHLIKIEPDARTLAAGTLPTPPKTCTQENLDGWRCWTHTGVAHSWMMNTEQVKG